ncbi:MAG TPA: ATP-binding protein [Bacillota bacterium]|nr:ATP-binding protein [Bacillota bacterium]
MLRRSNAARLAYFTRYTMGHAQLQAALSTVVRALGQPADTFTPVVLVIGPAGVGKTTLLHAVSREVTRQVRPTLAADPGRLPCVCLVTDVPASGSFSWKEYCHSALVAMHEPLIERKVPLPEGAPPRLDGAHLLLGQRGSEALLRRALVQAAKHRAPTAFLVDEAQHAALIVGGRKLQQQMDYIKRLADATGVPHVLFGNYGLCLLRNLSGQLGRRTEDVHFRRYDAARPQDVADFRDVVLSFQCHLPLPTQPDLLTDWEYLYLRSVGCVGLLKGWLKRALARALEEGAPTVTPAVLRRAAPPPSKSTQVLKEALEGEAQLAELDEDADLRGAEADLRRLLRLGAGSAQGVTATVPSPAAELPRPPRVRRAVGVRAATRDPVRGSASHDAEGRAG